MNHRIPSSFAAALSTLALTTVVVAGCGQAFSLTGGTSGSGGAGGDGAVAATAAASGTGGATATVSASSTSASATSSTSSGSMGCGINDDCPAQQFCLKSTCAAGVTGMCQPVTGIHADYAPVCGCDGVTYWNNIYGSASAEAIHKSGPCGANDKPKLCGAAAPSCTGANERCAVARKNCTDLATPGTCWVVPDNCELTTQGVETCEPGKAGECRKLCTLITQGQAFTASPTCKP